MSAGAGIGDFRKSLARHIPSRLPLRVSSEERKQEEATTPPKVHMLSNTASTFPLTATRSSDQRPQHHEQTRHHLSTTTTSPSHFAAAPRASSENGLYTTATAASGTSSPRPSCADEAQACFNLLLILRADTQHLISLRNDNIDVLEKTPKARPLLSRINEALAAAARSIAELGPFLERHRWPAIASAAAQGNDDVSQLLEQRCPLLLKPVYMLRRQRGPATRKRSQSFSTSRTTAATAAGRGVGGRPTISTGSPPNPDEETSWLSPECLFAWTLELTAQHTAALVALDRLERFLAHGSAALEQDDKATNPAAEAEAARRKRDSWWEQQRGEFENVGLIQSLLTGPRKQTRRLSGETTSVASASTTIKEMVVAAAACEQLLLSADGDNLASVSEKKQQGDDDDDGRSMTITTFISEPPSEVSSTPPTPLWGLTARPRVEPLRMSDNEAADLMRARRVVTMPVSPSTPQQVTYDHPQLSSRSETFGLPDDGASKGPSTTTTVPLSRFNSLRQRPRITTQPLPPLFGAPAILQPQKMDSTTTRRAAEEGGVVPRTCGTNNYLSPPVAGGVPSLALYGAPSLSLLSPLLTPGSQQAPSPSTPLPTTPAVETPYTPYTPLDQQLASLFAQQALPSKTIQPVIRELEDMLVSPVESQEGVQSTIATASPGSTSGGGLNSLQHVSPVTAVAWIGGSNGDESASGVPRKDSLASVSAYSQDQQQRMVGSQWTASPAPNEHPEIAVQAAKNKANDKHWPYLAYMARKQAVATSRWSLRQTSTTVRDSG